MKRVAELLNGRKTYILAVLGIVYLLGGSEGWWEVREEVLGVLGFGAAGALRMGMKNGGSGPAAR